MTQTVWEIAKTALDTLHLPYGTDAFIPDDTTGLPDVYLVFFLVVDDHLQHADNHDTLRLPKIQVSYFSRSGLANMPNLDAVMEGAGFINGPRRGLPYNHDSRHFGVAYDYVYLQNS